MKHHTMHDAAFPVGKISFQLVGGVISGVPRWAVPLLEAHGLVRTDGVVEQIDVRTALTTANTGELATYLNAHGVADHWFDRHTHYHSAQLRALGKASPVPTSDGEELHAAAADALDDFYRTVTKQSMGRIVVMSEAEQRRRALELYDNGGLGSPEPTA
jgi:hypothetical protein